MTRLCTGELLFFNFMLEIQLITKAKDLKA